MGLRKVAVGLVEERHHYGCIHDGVDKVDFSHIHHLTGVHSTRDSRAAIHEESASFLLMELPS
jgi:hypothetical protein